MSKARTHGCIKCEERTSAADSSGAHLMYTHSTTVSSCRLGSSESLRGNIGPILRARLCLEFQYVACEEFPGRWISQHYTQRSNVSKWQFFPSAVVSLALHFRLPVRSVHCTLYITIQWGYQSRDPSKIANVTNEANAADSTTCKESPQAIIPIMMITQGSICASR